jgi:glutamine synthetase
MTYKAEYIWIDGTEPTAQLRSKTKVLPDGAAPPIWGFDGSSTNQAPGKASDCVLEPVCIVPDPIRGGDNKLVMCEVLLTDMTPHPTNTRAALRDVAARYAEHEPWFGIEQEYTLFKDGRPLGFPEGGFPGPQGPYYCSVGAANTFGRQISEDHATACMEAGLAISGTNAEVMPGQWEFQIGPAGPLEASDHLWLARWLLHRIAEDHGVVLSIDAKPMPGDWNGAGAHTNFSTAAMRESYEPVIAACEALADNALEHVKAYGYGIEERLTGLHETAPWSEFNYGVSDRGASVRIPWQVAREGRGYIEDRRPNANCDPYVVTRMIVGTCCEALARTKELVA